MSRYLLAFFLPISLAMAADTAPGPRIVQTLGTGPKAGSHVTRTLDDLPAAATAGGSKRDEFGGLLGGDTRKATGFFHAEKIGQRWWLIDPKGNRYFNVAVNSVRPTTTPGFKDAYEKKFGGSADAWRDTTAQSLWDLGFNGTGSWSDDARFSAGKRRVAYTPQLNIMSSYGKKRGGVHQQAGHMGYENDCIFVFDPEFPAFAEELTRTCAALKDDPWLLGYFSDNELPFPSDALDKFLRLKEGEAGRKEAERFLKERKLAAPTDAARDAFRAHVSDTYFGICNAAIKKSDPNHLYLGSRLQSGERGSKAFLAAMGKHVDVAAMNIYGLWTPTADAARWAEALGKPIMATEWYAKGADTGMKNRTGAGFTVATQAERGMFYQNFALGLIESKACVGWHWFKYADNDPADLSTDPSNRDSNKGIIDSKYELYVPLTERMKALNAAMYSVAGYFDGK